MPWSVDDDGLEYKTGLHKSEEQKIADFVNRVNAGEHPSIAAANGGYNYTKLKGTENQFEIRLSGGNRLTFTIDEQMEVVKLLQVGHT